jgi:membrane-associated phospholipid phosphatase
MLDVLLEILYTCYNYIGEHGPIILIITTIFLLKNKDNLLFYYLIGIFINTILNLILKIILKQPRPDEDPKKFDIALKHFKHTFKDGIPFNIFGMPSGHSQNVLFSTIFIYLSLHNRKVLYFYLAISLFTLCQRITSKSHTISQIIVGSFVGTLVAYFMYQMAQNKLKGKIRERKDDNGPI